MIMQKEQNYNIGFYLHNIPVGFPDSSADEEFTCNAGDPSSISGWGRRRAWQPRFLPRESPWTEEPGGLQSMGPQSQTRLSD